MTQPEDCTLQDLSTLNLTQQPLYVTYPETIGNFELKIGLNLLTSFHKCAGKDP